MKFKQRLIFLISLALVASVVLIVYYSTPRTHFYYNSFGTNIPEGDYKLGLDVSHYQGNINWTETDTVIFNRDSISFAFIKASEGGTGKDKMFTTNVKSLEKTDIPFSCYHYFHPNESALKQAQHFTSIIEFAPFTLKPVIDIEVTEDRTKDELIDSVMVFLDYIEKELKTRPLVYTYSNFYEENFKGSELEKEVFWMANYNSDFDFNKQENAIIWQFTDKATVNGIGSLVDLNLVKRKKWNLILR